MINKHFLSRSKDEHPEENASSSSPRRALAFGGGGLLVAETISGFAHLGPTGFVLGGAIAAYLAHQFGEDIYQYVRGTADTGTGAIPQWISRRSPASKEPPFIENERSEEVVYNADEEDDTRYVSEESFSDVEGEARPPLQQKLPLHPSEMLLLTRGLDLTINEVIDAGVFVSGMKGSGKSEFAARLMEQIGRFPIVQIIYDLKGDFVSLARSEPPYLQNPVIMTRERQYSAETILSCGLQVVIDLRTWPDMEQRAQVIAQLNSDLLKYMMRSPMRFPWFVHLDEAQQFVAQVKPVGLEPATWRAATQSVTNLGVLGRSYGAVPCLYTQCIAAIHKDVIRQQELRIFMKVAERNDLDCYESYIEKAVAPRHSFAGFRPGDAVAILPDGKQLIVRFERRQSQHNSHTPHLTDALLHHEQASRRAPTPIEQVAQEQNARQQLYRYQVDTRTGMEDIPLFPSVERPHLVSDEAPRYAAPAAPRYQQQQTEPARQGRHIETSVEREWRLRNRGRVEEEVPVQVIGFQVYTPLPTVSNEPRLTFTEKELDRAEYEWHHGYGSIAKLKGRLETLTGKKVSWYYPRQICEKLEELRRIKMNRPKRPVMPDERTDERTNGAIR